MRQYFEIKGIPKPQARARFFVNKKGGIGKYDPNDSANEKENIRAQIAICNPQIVPIREGIALSVKFIFPRSKGHFGKKGLLPSAPKNHTSRPDIDNCLKGLMDACKGVLWIDDTQIVTVLAEKIYGIDKAQTVISLVS